MANSRYAAATLFQLDFQISAAIVLMLDHIRDLRSVQLAGDHADIALTLCNGKQILAHTAPIVPSGAASDHVLGHLEEALRSLSEGARNTDAQELIFITNASDPCRDDASKGIFSAPSARRSYADLPESAQRILADCLKGIANPLDFSEFAIQTFRFAPDNSETRDRLVLESVRDFIGSFQTDLSYGLDKRLLPVWRDQFLANGATQNPDSELRKEDLVWPILVFETEASGCGEAFQAGLDPSVCDEAAHRVQEVMDLHRERIPLFRQVLWAYRSFQTDETGRDRLRAFVDGSWERDRERFRRDGISDEVLEALTKMILYRIVGRRTLIERVLEAVNL